MAEGETPRIVPLPHKASGEGRSLKAPGNDRPATKRRRSLKLSFIVCVLVPALLGAVYYAFVASDRYVAGAGFAVRGMDGGVRADLLSTFTGLANTGSTSSDSYIVLEYLKSRDIVERLAADFDIRAAYSAEGIDFFSRLDPAAPAERLVDYWDGRIATTYDSNSGIITFDVQAFRPADAQRIATLVLGYCKDLVNELSGKARRDAVAYARLEVSRSEEKLLAALEKLRRFRSDEQALDPARSARLQMEIVGDLEKQLLETRARMAALEGTVSEESPSMRTLSRRAAALESQIAAKKREISSGKGDRPGRESALAGQLAAYETLEVERDFAQKSYASALSSLEKARVEADRQQRYLAVYSTPALPEYATYPRRLRNVLLILVALAGLWAIGALVVYSVRDHMT